MSITAVLAPPAWTEFAVCAQSDPEQWFPEGGFTRARRICQDCPVIEPCRAYGMDERWGVWGGLTALERRRLGRGRGRPGLDYDIPEEDR